MQAPGRARSYLTENRGSVLMFVREGHPLAEKQSSCSRERESDVLHRTMLREHVDTIRSNAAPMLEPHHLRRIPRWLRRHERREQPRPGTPWPPTHIGAASGGPNQPELHHGRLLRRPPPAALDTRQPAPPKHRVSGRRLRRGGRVEVAIGLQSVPPNRPAGIRVRCLPPEGRAGKRPPVVTGRR